MSRAATPVPAPVPAPVQETPADVDSAPRPTGSEAVSPASVLQRQPQRATVEEVEDE
jgi:translocation protein SEC62